MSPSNQISVLSPLIVGVVTTLCTIIVHGLILVSLVTAVRSALPRGRIGVRPWASFLFVTNATLLALAGHLVEIGLWALSFLLCGEFSNFAEAFYYSAANYTTVGDGTIAISARWRLMGPLEASDGMLMFGASTAMVFAVIQRLVQPRYRERNG
jgi:Ion channel